MEVGCLRTELESHASVALNLIKHRFPIERLPAPVKE
jgi:hypothetical protein